MLSKPLVIGLCGFADAGKDTVADLLRTHCGAYKLAFADALRVEICDAFQCEPALFTRRELKEQPMAELALLRCKDSAYIGAALRYLAERAVGGIGIRVSISDEISKPRTPRETMQLWGTQFRRAQDVSYWERKVRNRIAYQIRCQGQQLFVVTDVRFLNEAETVRNLGGQLWQVRRPARAGQTEGGHSSATDGAEFNPERVLGNSHDIRHLQQLVLGAFCEIAMKLPGVRLEIPA